MRTFERNLDELMKSDEEVFEEDRIAQQRVKSGEPVSATLVGIPGIKELPLA